MCDVQRWRGDAAARRAVYNNRNRLRSDLGKEALRLRAEKVERSFEHTLDRGGMRRAWLRGRANLQKRYLVHVAAYNLGLVMRLLLGAGTPRWLASRSGFIFWLIDPAAGLVIILISLPPCPATPPHKPTSSTACYGWESLRPTAETPSRLSKASRMPLRRPCAHQPRA
jgi:hypothetical protein